MPSALSERNIVGIVFSVVIFVGVGCYCCCVWARDNERRIVVSRDAPIMMQDNTGSDVERRSDVEHVVA